ncbi:Coiled-coil domain-containing protein 81, partial [Colius striatus]
QGVLVAGLGTFAVVQERFRGKEVEYVIQRPVFQLDADVLRLLDLTVPQENIPDSVEVEPLDYTWLSQATSFPPPVVESCVQETTFLYTLQLWDGQHRAFAFRDIGVLSWRHGVLCMRFHGSCVAALESRDTPIALLRT